MSAEKRPKEPPPKERKPRLSDSVLACNVKLAGIARTTNGFCVAEVEVAPDGKVVNVTLEPSERYPQFVAARAKQRQLKLALEAQRNAGAPKSALGMQKLTTAGRNWGSY